MGAASPDQSSELTEALAALAIQAACVDGLESIRYSLDTEPIDAIVIDEALVAPSTWPDILRRVPTVVLVDRPGRHPQATHELDRADHAGLLRVLDELFATPGR